MVQKKIPALNFGSDLDDDGGCDWPHPSGIRGAGADDESDAEPDPSSLSKEEWNRSDDNGSDSDNDDFEDAVIPRDPDSQQKAQIEPDQRSPASGAASTTPASSHDKPVVPDEFGSEQAYLNELQRRFWRLMHSDRAIEVNKAARRHSSAVY